MVASGSFWPIPQINSVHGAGLYAHSLDEQRDSLDVFTTNFILFVVPKKKQKKTKQNNSPSCKKKAGLVHMLFSHVARVLV